MHYLTRRLQLFSDTILAIVGTILAPTLLRIDDSAKLDIYLHGRSLGSALGAVYLLESFVMFAGAFAMIYIIWARHGRQFTRNTREEVAWEGPSLLIASGMELCLISVLPYTTACAARARISVGDLDQEERRNLALPFCANVVALGIVRVVFEALALRARPSIGTAYYNLCEAATETGSWILVSPLALSLLRGEVVFAPFLAVPIASAAVRSALVLAYGEPEHRLIDWSRLERFVDCSLAVVVVQLILMIKPPGDCADMGKEACVLHFEGGCRLAVNGSVCYYERAEEQTRAIGLMTIYFAVFCLLGLLWTSYHEVILWGFGASRRDVSDKGSSRALLVSGWFCGSVAVLPFAFSLVQEFVVSLGTEGSSEGTPAVEVDVNAKITSCYLTLGVLLSCSCALATMLLVAPRRRTIQSSTVIRTFALPLVLVINVSALAVNGDVTLWPLLLLLPLLASSNIVGKAIDLRLRESRSINVDLGSLNVPLLEEQVENGQGYSILIPESDHGGLFMSVPENGINGNNSRNGTFATTEGNNIA